MVRPTPLSKPGPLWWDGVSEIGWSPVCEERMVALLIEAISGCACPRPRRGSAHDA